MTSIGSRMLFPGLYRYGEDLRLKMYVSIKDNVINMCEIKYYGGEFTVKKDYYQKLLRRQEMLMEEVSPKVSIRSTLITTYGLEHNEYSGIFTNVVLLDDLFE